MGTLTNAPAQGNGGMIPAGPLRLREWTCANQKKGIQASPYETGRRHCMKTFRSGVNFRILFLVLAVVLSSSAADISRGIAGSLDKIPVIENSTASAVLDAGNAARIKPGFPGIVFAHVSLTDSSLASAYACVRMPYPSPKDVYLSAESQRGPPWTILFHHQTLV